MARQIPALIEWIADSQRRADLASAVDTSGDYLYQIATGRRRASPDLASAIDKKTGGAVSKEILIFGPAPIGKESEAKPSKRPKRKEGVRNAA